MIPRYERRHGDVVTYDDYQRHSISVTSQGWAAMRRSIAFLRSDVAWREPEPRPGRERLQRTFALASVVAVPASVVIAIMTSQLGWLLLPGLLVGVPLTMWALLPKSDDAEPAPFWPFRDEADWRRTEHLVHAEGLPPYDLAVHTRPIRGLVSRAFMSIASVPTVIAWALILAPLLSPLLFLRSKND